MTEAKVFSEMLVMFGTHCKETGLGEGKIGYRISCTFLNAFHISSYWSKTLYICCATQHHQSEISSVGLLNHFGGTYFNI